MHTSESDVFETDDMILPGSTSIRQEAPLLP